ncbi:MAG: beta-phosphoglucomutase [Fusobacteriota bacterium]
MKKKGFIFDLDGVITDTAEYHYLGWKKMAQEEGLKFNRNINEKLRGVSRLASLNLILDFNNKPMAENKKRELTDRKNKYYQAYLKEMTEDDYLEGVEDLLKDLKSRGIKIGLGSASRNAKTVLKALNAEKYFDSISDGHSVKKGKPAPDLFWDAADKLGLKPEECVVVEDAASGVEAAKKAGMTAVGIGPEERVGKADYRYDKPKFIDLEEILG